MSAQKPATINLPRTDSTTASEDSMGRRSRLQIDGSDHRWFEDRDAPCTLIVAVDDATGAIQDRRAAEVAPQAAE